jgi:putative oxidoreductase
MIVVDVVSLILQILLALLFIMAGIGKTAGSKMHIENFDNWRLPQWFRTVTGLCQILGVVALIIGFWEPSWVAVGALWFAIISLGGILTHVRIKDSFKDMFMIIILFIISAALFIINIDELANFPGFQ